MPSARNGLRPALAVLAVLWLGGSTPAIRTEAARPAAYATRLDVPALTGLGRTLFFDRSLSSNGRVACASCHDPAHAYGPPNGAAIQPSGSAVDDRSGLRAAPSLRYLQSVPPFAEHSRDNEGDDSGDQGPTGGYGWDGRAASAHDQARLPLLSTAEMGNPDVATVAAKLQAAPYAPALRTAFGADLFARGADAVVDAAAMALEVYQQSPADFQPYSSRYDAVLRGQATLTPQEARGRALFDDPAKGNCASCHLSAPTPDGAFPLFSDFGHIALGVPRNPAVPANADPRFFDLGLCGPLRTDDHAGRPGDCGRFRTPSLRNVAVRRSFFHNGVVGRLDDAIRFYATRDSDPVRWYGPAARFDDLPARDRVNVHAEAPFGRARGAPPALTEPEIQAIAAFLRTLTDHDQLAGISAAPAPARR